MTKLFLCSLLVLSLTLSSTVSGALIEDTCRGAVESSPNIKYDFCIASMQAAPNSGAASNIVDVGMIAIDLLQKNVTANEALANRLLKNPKFTPGVQAGLKDCAESYSDSVSTVGDAMEDFKSGDYQGTNIKVSAVFDGAYDCEHGFGDGGQGSGSPLSKNNDDVIELSALVLYIAH